MMEPRSPNRILSQMLLCEYKKQDDLCPLPPNNVAKSQGRKIRPSLTGIAGSGSSNVASEYLYTRMPCSVFSLCWIKGRKQNRTEIQIKPGWHCDTAFLQYKTDVFLMGYFFFGLYYFEGSLHLGPAILQAVTSGEKRVIYN